MVKLLFESAFVSIWAKITINKLKNITKMCNLSTLLLKNKHFGAILLKANN